MVKTPDLAPARVQLLPLRPLGRVFVGARRPQAPAYQGSPHSASILALRAVARRYSRQMQREVEREARLREWELAA